jgi:hypothetical protein
MRKTFLTISLLLAITLVANAGETPIAGYAGCAPGLWYPESQVCCMPGLECPVGRLAPTGDIKVEPKTGDTIWIKVILSFRNFF